MQTASRAGILLSLALAAAPLAANADVYKCVTDGQTTYSSTPCNTKAAPQVQTSPNQLPPLPAAPTTQTTVSSKQVSTLHYEPVEQESSKSGMLGFDMRDGLTIALMVIVPVFMVTLLFMSRRTRGLTK